MNLVTNGIEAISGPGRVTIATSSTSKKHEKSNPPLLERDCCVLAVSDNGPGIRSEDVAHIFDPFYTRKVMGKSGTGLGLTIVQNVVKQHGGEIELRSAETGTTFTVYLPTGIEPVDGGDEQAGDQHFGGSEKILLVDDEELQRSLGSRFLISLGYQVDTVSSGEEALTYLQTRKVDLLVLDMVMPPGLNGLETYRQALDRYPDQRAIIVSGYTRDEVMQEAYELGITTFVPKPYAINQLARSVRQALDG